MSFVIETIDLETVRLVRETGRDAFGDPAQRMTVREANAMPCRVTLEDAEIGEEVLLFRYDALKQASPYRFSGPVFVRAKSADYNGPRDRLPDAVSRRLLSLRGFDAEGRIVRSDVAPGTDAVPIINELLREPGVDAVHIHTARNGCWMCTARAA